MQKLDTRTSIIIIGIVFLVGVILCVVLFSMSDDLSALDFPLGFKFLFELIVYGISLFLFSNYKFKPTLWSKGFLIIVFFRFLFAIVVGLIVFLLFAKPPQNFGTVFIDALYRFNYSFILQVLFSPCLAYPLLNAVITEKVELEKAVKEASTKLRTSVPPPPPSTELPPEWIEDISTGEAGEIVEESSKSTKEISSELLKELGLSDLVEQQESEKTTSDKSDVEKTPTKKESSKSMDSDLKELLGQLDSKSFFEESGKSGSVKPKETEKPELDKQKPPDATQDLLDELAAFENSEGLKSIIPTEMPKIPESGIPEIKETAKSPLDRLSSKSEKSEVEKSVSELDDVLDLGLELPDFNIPGFEEKPEGKTEAEIKLPKFETESQKLESSKQKEQTRQPQEKVETEIIPPKEVLPQPDVELQEEKPAEKPEEKNLELDINELLGEIELPPLLIPSVSENEEPSIPEEEIALEEMVLSEDVGEEKTFAETDLKTSEVLEEPKPNLDEFLNILSENDLPAMSFEEKPIISLDELPPLPDFPGMDVGIPENQSEEEENKPDTEEEEKKKVAREKPSAKELAGKPTDLITLSVRRIIDYGKNSEASAVLNKLLRRGSDYKLQVPLSLIMDQFGAGAIELTADYIYNQVPIELVNFISAEQGRNLQELKLIIPLADVMQQVSPSIIMNKMPEEREESKWASEASELSEKIAFDEKDL